MLFFQSTFCSNELKWIKIFNFRFNSFSFAGNFLAPPSNPYEQVSDQCRLSALRSPFPLDGTREGSAHGARDSFVLCQIHSIRTVPTIPARVGIGNLFSRFSRFFLFRLVRGIFGGSLLLPALVTFGLIVASRYVTIETNRVAVFVDRPSGDCKQCTRS